MDTVCNGRDEAVYCAPSTTVIRLHVRLLLLLVLGLSLAACETPTAFERDNTNDPASPRYTPDLPTGLQLEGDGYGVRLTWEDNSLGEDGFLIEKALGPDGTFTELAQVAADTDSFLDESGDLAPVVRYRVRVLAGTNTSVPLEAHTATLQLPELTGFATSLTDEALALTWDEAATSVETNVRVELDEGAGFATVADVPRTEAGVRLSLDGLTFRAYSLRITHYYPAADDPLQLTRFESVEDAAAAFAPSDLNVEVHDERTLTLSWVDNSLFETGFVVEATNGTDRVIRVLAPDVQTMTLDTLLTDGDRLDFQVRAVDHTNRSAPAERRSP